MSWITIALLAIFLVDVCEILWKNYRGEEITIRNWIDLLCSSLMLMISIGIGELGIKNIPFAICSVTIASIVLCYYVVQAIRTIKNMFGGKK